MGDYAQEKIGLMISQNADNQPITSNMRAFVLNAVARNADSLTQLTTLYETTDLVEVKEDICRAMGKIQMNRDKLPLSQVYSTSNALLVSVINFAFDKKRRVTEQLFILAALSRSS